MHLNLSVAELTPVMHAALAVVLTELPGALVGGQPVYSHRDVAKMLGVTTCTLHEYRKAGRIKGSRVGKGYAYTRHNLLDFMQETEE